MHGFHVLSADVQNKIDVWLEVVCCLIVSNRFDFSEIGFQSAFDQMFTVSGRACFGNRDVFRKMLVHFRQNINRLLKRITVIVAVPSVKNFLVFAHQNDFGRCRTGIDSQISLAAICFKRTKVNFGFGMAIAKFFQLFFVVKERIERFCRLKRRTDMGKRVKQVCDGRRFFFACVKCSALGHEELRIFRKDDVFFFKMQRLDESLAQFAHEVKRTAQKSNVALNLMAGCKTCDRLVDDSLKNRGSEVFLTRAIVDQRLNVSLGKNAAARGNRINVRISFCQFVQTVGIGFQQTCHLINEGPGSAGTRSVHFLFKRCAEKRDFGIFAAKFNGNVGLRTNDFDRFGAGDNFLDEFEVQDVGQAHAARAGNRK